MLAVFLFLIFITMMKKQTVSYLIPVLIISLGTLYSCTQSDAFDFQFSVDESFDPGPSGQSFMSSTESGEILMSWIAHDEQESILNFSSYDGEWKDPKEITRGEDWFVNFADFPSIISNGNNLFAHHLKSSGPSYFAYDIKVSVSDDAGDSWSEPFTPHKDGTITEHGFVSTVAYKDGFYSIWLDGRHTDGDHGGGDMQLMGAYIGNDGSVSDKVVLNPRVCECCQTSLTVTENGLIAVYRGRSENEVRDTWYQKYDGEEWGNPKLLYKDNWQISGCPVNGPVVRVNGQKIAIAWFTAVDDDPKVKVAFSKNNGKTFDSPFVVNKSFTFGRVNMRWLNDDHVVISFVEDAEAGAHLAVRTVSVNGRKGKVHTVVADDYVINNASGFPQLIKSGNELWLSWTQPWILDGKSIVKRAKSEIIDLR